MSKFAHYPMYWRDLFGRNFRKQPGRKKSKKLRRIGRGKSVRGKEKYQACPCADGQPVFDLRFPVMRPIRDGHFRDGFNAPEETRWRKLRKNPSPVFSVADYRAKKIA